MKYLNFLEFSQLTNARAVSRFEMLGADELRLTAGEQEVFIAAEIDPETNEARLRFGLPERDDE